MGYIEFGDARRTLGKRFLKLDSENFFTVSVFHSVNQGNLSNNYYRLLPMQGMLVITTHCMNKAWPSNTNLSFSLKHKGFERAVSNDCFNFLR